jgi:hypothetical protein
MQQAEPCLQPAKSDSPLTKFENAGGLRLGCEGIQQIGRATDDATLLALG